MPLEKEVKFLGPDLESVRLALVRADAQDLGRDFETNLVFDDPSRSLKAASILLRLRRARKALLTCKRPVAGGPEGMKVKEEMETEVADFGQAKAILETLGYSVSLRYEKFRHSFKLGGAVVCLDVLPFGEFVEIEAGSAEELEQTAGRIGLDGLERSTASYHDLNREHRARLGLAEEESFVFPDAQRLLLLDRWDIGLSSD